MLAWPPRLENKEYVTALSFKFTDYPYLSLPYLYAQHMTEEIWEKALAAADIDDKTASKFRRCSRLQPTGDVLIVELFSAVHECVGGSFTFQVVLTEKAMGIPEDQRLSYRGTMSK